LARGLSAEAPPYPRLRFAAREVEAIRALLPVNRSSVWLGASASRETLLGADLRRYRFLHFATHGVLGGNGLGESALVLSRFDSRGRPQPALLTSSEIARLHISADLVVLSACDSALGQGDAGEGATGLGQSFLEAGAKSVLVSLWSVDDRATEELMTQFYRNLLQQRLSPASALRQAQLSLSHRPPWDDPFYWAGFVLVGDGG
jgi:CHAT domain-containing protein